ncbi:MAG: UDP-glucose/GDP-mannose dehydrogenase family protein [Firmicutes bacterium]|nr:UDP-glucose/GDP-mannose dehydrogenase family protein [Bacillota bacterium]
MKVAVVGGGYVGLVAAACLSRSGHHVVCVEKDEKKLAMLQAGEPPFFETGLAEIIAGGMAAGTLHFDQTMKPHMHAEVMMVAVGTPSRQDKGIDLSHIHAVMADIVEYAARPMLVVMKSTVPPGFGVNLKDRFLVRARAPIGYVSNPEFLREGFAVHDWYNPDRIVIGGDDPGAVNTVAGLYRGIEAPVLKMDISSAEMTKYAANAFLATKISFINEIANLCELVGADILPVAGAVGLDRRIGPEFLQAGLGYGGSCFPKDTCGLDFVSTCNGYAFNLLKAVIEVNNRQRVLAMRKLRLALGKLHNKTVGVLGLAFKPGTDDVRESPSLDIIRLLLDEGVNIRAYDPLANNKAREVLPPSVFFASSPQEAAAGSNALLAVTAWPEFTNLDWFRIGSLMKPPYVVLDGRNCLPAKDIAATGLYYLSIGRPPVSGNDKCKKHFGLRLNQAL